MGDRKRSLALEAALSQETIRLWMPALEHFASYWLSFYDELCLALVDTIVQSTPDPCLHGTVEVSTSYVCTLVGWCRELLARCVQEERVVVSDLDSLLEKCLRHPNA
jgi:hypothetical protein